MRGTGTGLAALGLPHGARVLLRLGNSVDFPLAYLGAIAVGLVPVPTSTALTGPEITALAHAVNPALVIAGDGVALPDHPAPVLQPEALRRFRDLPPCPYDMGAPDRPAYIVFTSGSSGRSRAVVHAHRAVWARRMMWDGWYGLQRTDRVLHAGAFNWTYTLGTGLMDPWAIGATALVTEPDAPVALLLHRHDATIFAAVPGLYRQMLAGGRLRKMPHLRHGVSAGEKLPDSTRSAWLNVTGTAIHEALGMSECSTFISGSPARPAPGGATGFAQAGRRVTVLGPDGTATDEGILAVHKDDPGLMLGYLEPQGQISLPLQGAWFLTGDRVRREADGAVHYLGRDDDMMNAGGFRVAPPEVERALADYPELDDIAVTDVEIRPGVRVIAAFYTSAQTIAEDALTAFAAQRLARYKQPRLYRRVPVLPRGANGKLSRRNLRAQFKVDDDHA